MDLAKLLKPEEKIALKLRTLYRNSGYHTYKMSKFEEYDFYANKKDFLLGDNVITFTDTNGRLMALRPDVTLSIIKNYKEDSQDIFTKVFYSEKIYRNSQNGFKEFFQIGLENLGKQDLFSKIEVLNLANLSLETINEILKSNNKNNANSDFILEISHMGFLAYLLKKADAGLSFDKEIIFLISQKNTNSIQNLCKKFNINDDLCLKFTKLSQIYGNRLEVLEKLQELFKNDDLDNELNELKAISGFFDDSKNSKNVRFDFSLVNDMKYYNGLVFQGFIEGVPDMVLSGGQYDHLMQSFSHKNGGIGFALYLDYLDDFYKNIIYDVDKLILYDEKTNLENIFKKINEYKNSNLSFCVQKKIPKDLKYKELIDLKGDKNE